MKREEVRIRTPCGADWDSMDARGSARLCGQCDKLVHDLSGMGERAARELLGSTSGSLCVRYLYDATGRIWFEDKQELVLPAALHRKRRSLAAAAVMAAAPMLFQACGGAGLDDYPYQANAGSGQDGDAGAATDANPDANPGAVSGGAANGEGGASGDPEANAGAGGRNR